LLSVVAVLYIRTYGTDERKLYFQRGLNDSYYCSVRKNRHQLLSLSIEDDANSSNSGGSSEDCALSFQEVVELHLADPSVMLPLANNEAERHYVTVRLQEHRDREKEKNALQAKKEEEVKALQAKKKEEVKAKEVYSLQREGFLTNFLGFVILGAFINQGITRGASRFEPKVDYFLKIAASINDWLYSSSIEKMFGNKAKRNIQESTNDDDKT